MTDTNIPDTSDDRKSSAPNPTQESESKDPRILRIAGISVVLLILLVIFLTIFDPGTNSPPLITTTTPTSSTSANPSSSPILETPIANRTLTPDEERLEQRCTYVVSPYGSDDNNGIDSTTPFRTIKRGVNELKAGDFLCVRGGTYYERVTIQNSGTNQEPITVMAYPGEFPIIDGRSGVECVNCGLPDTRLYRTDPISGKGFTYEPLVGIEGDYVHLLGFTITRSMGRCVRVWNEDRHVSGTVIKDNVIHDCRNAGIMFVNAPINSLIENNEVSGASSYATYARSASSLDWSAAVAVVDGVNTVVRGNLIHENYGEGVTVGRRQTDVVFEDNVVYDNYALQLYIHATDNVLVQRNLFYHTGNPQFFRSDKPSACIVLASSEPQFNSGNLTNVKVINNVAVGCSNNFAFWSGAAEIHNILVAHNTFVNAQDPTSTQVAIRVGHSDKGNMFDVLIANNLVLQEDGDLIEEYGQDGVSYANNLWSNGRPRARVRNPGDIFGDPMLENPNAPLIAGEVLYEWYMLKADSPAVDSGTSLSDVREDFLRIPRDQTPEIGAFELGDGNPE